MLRVQNSQEENVKPKLFDNGYSYHMYGMLKVDMKLVERFLLSRIFKKFVHKL